MSHTTIATQVHKALDRHRNFAAKVAFNDVLPNLVADFAQAQRRLNPSTFFGVIHTCGFKDFSGARTTDTVNGCQTDLCVLPIGDIMPAIRAMIFNLA
jgi:hypothetical protein